MTHLRHRNIVLLTLCVGVGAPAAMGQSGPPARPEGRIEVAADTPETLTSANLLPNGGFDEPDAAGEGPARWFAVDGLVFNWTTDPAAPERRKVMRIDTAVDQGQALNWWVRRFVHGEPLAAAPPREPGSGYSHVGAEVGGFFWSDLIPVAKGGAFKVYVDARGPKAKVFIRGYEKRLPLSFADEQPRVQQEFRVARGEPEVDENGRPVRYRLRFRYQTWFAVGGSDRWQTYTHVKPRHPNSREITEDVRFIRIMLYPYWPPGDYWFDNVRVVEVEPELRQAWPDPDEADVEEGKVIR